MRRAIFVILALLLSIPAYATQGVVNPVEEATGSISQDNSSTIALPIAGTYVGDAEDITDVAIIYISAYSDQAGTLVAEQSTDGTNWDYSDTFGIAADDGGNFSINPHAEFFRVFYTNGAVEQTEFRIQVKYLSVYGKPSSHRIQDAISTDDDAELVKSVLAGIDVDGTYTNTSVQHPLPSDGGSVYAQDVSFDDSDFTDWVGDPEDLFHSPFSASITNSTTDNPKQIVLAFNRTVNALQIGFGENNGGDFSNLKVSLLGSGGTTRSVFDESTDATDITSRNAEFENELFNSLLIEFYTADTVSLSNITIQRASYNTVQVQGIDEDGNFQTARVNSDGLLLTGDFFVEVAKGNIPGHSKVSKFGENNAVGNTIETVWDAGGLYPWATWDASGATILQVQSTLAADSLAGPGVGAHTVQIEGLAADWSEQIEVIEMDGVTPVDTVNEYRRLHRMAVLTAGTAGSAIGTITSENGGVVVAQIINGNNQTLMGVYTIPLGKTGYVVFGKASCGKAADAKVKFFARQAGGVFNVQHAANLYQNSYDYPFSAVPAVPEMTDLDVRAITTNPSGYEVTIAFDTILVDD